MEKWTIDATILFKQNGKILEKRVEIKEVYSSKEETLKRIEKLETDLYGFEIPIRLNESLIIRPSLVSGLIKLVKINKLTQEEVVLEFSTRKLN